MTGSEFNDHDQALVDIQCEIQLCDSLEEFYGFKIAYTDAKCEALEWVNAFKHWTDKSSIEYHHGLFKSGNILRYINNVWAPSIDPRNTSCYRRVPVYIGGEVRSNQDQISRQMSLWSKAFSEYINWPEKGEVEGYHKVNPNTLYEWFERIHPFIDGNGRTGHLVWAFAMTRLNGVWPRTLPPNVFDDPRLRNHIHVHGEHLVKWDIRSDVWDFDTGRWL